MPPQHPQYELPQKMLSCIQVFQDEEEVFNGRITECKIDFYNRKHFTCEGQLAYLNDSIQRPAEYHDMTVRGYLESLITSHNEQVKKDRQFKVGIVTVTDNNDSLYRYTNYNSTMKEIKEDLVDDLGGYLRVRNVNGTAYLDYISDYDNVSTQSIEFGENLLDFSRNTDVSDIATVFIPLGAKLEESPIAALEQRLTIESVNNGSDSLVNLDAVKKFGYITKTITWDEVTTPKMLLYKANKYIADYQWDSMTLEVNAVDMHWTDADIEQFKLGDKIKAHSSLHGLDRYFPLSKMSIQLNNLSSSKFTLGTVVNTKLTAKSQTISNTASKAVETIPVPSAIVKQAVDQATALITAATHGHVVTTANEQLIMDTNDVNTARKVWRWNLNGLGYSSTGYNGTYKTAITMDGQIVGERLVGGSVSAEKLDITYRNQVIKEIADAEESARSDAEDYTDGELKKYYTKSEVETSIKNTKDSILLLKAGTAPNAVPAQAVCVLPALYHKLLPENCNIIANSDFVTLTWNGQAAHASTPETGNNAITGLLELLAKLPDFPMCKALSACFPHGCTDGSNLGIACEDAESGALTCICSQLEIQGDKWVGMIDIRYPICTTKEAIFQQVQKRLKEAGCSCKVIIQNDPHVVPKESPFVQTLLRIYEEETGEKGECIAIGGGTYVHDIPGGVAFGAEFPNWDYHMHGDDEFVPIEHLMKDVRMMAAAILELCG